MTKIARKFPHVSLYLVKGRYRLTTCEIEGRRITRRLGITRTNAERFAAKASDWIDQWKSKLIDTTKLAQLIRKLNRCALLMGRDASDAAIRWLTPKSLLRNGLTDIPTSRGQNWRTKLTARFWGNEFQSDLRVKACWSALRRSGSRASDGGGVDVTRTQGSNACPRHACQRPNITELSEENTTTRGNRSRDSRFNSGPPFFPAPRRGLAKGKRAMKETTKYKADLEAMNEITKAFEPLSDEARVRVVAAVFAIYGDKHLSNLLMDHRARMQMDVNEKA